MSCLLRSTSVAPFLLLIRILRVLRVPRLRSFGAREYVIDVVVGAERNRAERPCLDTRDDVLAGELEDCSDNLGAFPGVRLRDDEEDASAVLNVARRQQLALQNIHDDRRLRTVKAAGIATSMQIGTKRRRPWVVAGP